jgi:hypothetical protein
MKHKFKKLHKISNPKKSEVKLKENLRLNKIMIKLMDRFETMKVSLRNLDKD